VICIHQSAKGLKVTAAVAYFIGEETVQPPPSPTNIYGSFWLFLSVAMLLVATLFIKHYERKQQPGSILAAERNRAARKSISLARILLGGISLALTVTLYFTGSFYGLLKDFPVQILLYAVVICVQLIFLALDDNILKFVQSKLAVKLVQIKIYFRSNFSFRPNQVNPS